MIDPTINKSTKEKQFNKELKTKSVFTACIMYGGYPVGYGNVILRQTENDAEIALSGTVAENSGKQFNAEKKGSKPKRYDIPYTIPEINAIIQLNVVGLKTIENKIFLNGYRVYKKFRGGLNRLMLPV